MIEEQIKLATCHVLCSSESGTGWLIASDTVLTAKHCVAPAIDDGHTITLKFGVGDHEQEYTATILATSPELDVCLLSLATPLPHDPLEILGELPRPGGRWFAFGHPRVKLLAGHRLQGTIAKVENGLPMGMDLDTSVDADTSLSDYRGFSGAPVVMGDRCVGMLRLGVDRSLGALSIWRMAGFLREHGLLPMQAPRGEPVHGFAERRDFIERFEAAVVARRSGYLFLEGAPGIGKSTFCSDFHPRTSGIEFLGAYSIGQRERGTSPAQRAQPEVLFDWLNMLFSQISTGKPARLLEQSYANLVAGTQRVLASMAKRCAAQGVVGVIFIDGLNEAAHADYDSFRRLVGLLPTTLDEGLLVVLTSPSFDSVSAVVGARVAPDARIVLPGLPHDAELSYCHQELSPDRVSSNLVTKVCERANGHPLYLRYLIDLVNTGATESEIDELPAFSGNIQVYYETIWALIVGDAQAVQLLGLIARLRWGIPIGEFVEILDASEKAAFITTLSRIRHLLNHPDETTIYHGSFAEFLAEKTRSLDEVIHARLAMHCQVHQDSDYCVLNLVYHGLRGGAAGQGQAVQNCQQAWVDNCVIRGVEPDLMLEDVDQVLAVASDRGAAVSVVRLLLLAQRIRFRYDTLFAQSAGLVAEALVALGKTEGALQHIYRYGRLIVSVDDVFKLSHQLICAGKPDVAWELLERVDADLFDDVMSEEQRFGEFLERVHCRLHLLVLMQLTGREGSRMNAPSFMLYSIQIIRLNTAQFPKEERERLGREVLTTLVGATLCLSGRASSLDKLPAELRAHLAGSLDLLSGILLDYREHVSRYQLPLDATPLKEVITAMEEIASTGLADSSPVSLGTLDTLVLTGAPCELVARLGAAQIAAVPDRISLVKPDNVTVDLDAFIEDVASWRVRSFVDLELEGPPVSDWSETGWMTALEELARGLSVCDGKARHAALQGDSAILEKVWSDIEACFFKPMRLSLMERVGWESGYAVPEAIFPHLYEQLTEICIACYPARLECVISFIDERFDDQCGVYSEGFRGILRAVLSRLSRGGLQATLSGRAIDLALRWKSYVLRNVQNRHELVPELLEMIPVLSQLQATEEAQRTYQDVLANSMGPSWYKEEQFSLMLSTLRSFHVDQPLPPTVLPQIETVLDAASGEITFQRYVRHAKSELISELARRGRYLDAVRYFQKQVCGTQDELFAQANEGEMDKPSPLEGMRYPGGALDEQAALASLLKEIPSDAGWQVCWALLEVYESGDERHLERWGEAYARLVGQNACDDTARAEIKQRMAAIVERAQTATSRQKLLGSIRSAPEVERVPDFVEFLDGLNIRAEVPAAGTDPSARPQSDVPLERKVAEAEGDPGADDGLVVPGTFGARGVIHQAAEALRQAQAEMDRRNTNAAKKEAVRVLQILQNGQWSVWQQLCTEARLAEEILSGSGSTAESLVKLYAPLLTAERHTQRWLMAQHLIRRTGTLLQPDDATAVIEVVLEHMQQLLGATSRQAPECDDAAERPDLGADAALHELLLWLLAHPNWQRRDAAARMVLWLMQRRDTFLRQVVSEASSMDSGPRADILCGAMDILSRENPEPFWNRIQPWFDVDSVVLNCQHAGRFGVILRIVQRAARAGSRTASPVFDLLCHALQGNNSPASPTATLPSVPPPAILEDFLAGAWRDLAKLGVATEAVARRVDSVLRDACAPLDVQTAAKLESLIAKGFSESEDFWLSRWQAKVRFSLNVALYSAMTPENIDPVERLLRIFNPESLHRLNGGRFPFASLVESLMSRGPKFKPSSPTHVYLSYQGYVRAGRNVFFLELTPFLTREGQKVTPQSPERIFTSIQLPEPGSNNPVRVCAPVQPRRAYFGALTPAIPVPYFLDRSGASAASFERSYWREAVDSTEDIVVHSDEGCLLSIVRDALRLPDGYRLAWTVSVNRKVETILDQY